MCASAYLCRCVVVCGWGVSFIFMVFGSQQLCIVVRVCACMCALQGGRAKPILLMQFWWKPSSTKMRAQMATAVLQAVPLEGNCCVCVCLFVCLFVCLCGGCTFLETHVFLCLCLRRDLSLNNVTLSDGSFRGLTFLEEL